MLKPKAKIYKHQLIPISSPITQKVLSSNSNNNVLTSRDSKILVEKLPTQCARSTMVFEGDIQFLSVLFLQVSPNKKRMHHLSKLSLWNPFKSSSQTDK